MRALGTEPGVRRLRSASDQLTVGWPGVVLAALVLVCGAIDLWWLHHFRAGYPLDINESQYMGFALALKQALAHHGLHAMWHVWAAEGQFGPLVPLVSVPVFVVFGGSVVAGMATQLVFFAALSVGSYALGARLARSRPAGLLVALAVAATPIVTDFTRSYEFPVAAAAVLTCCTYALLASEGLSRRGPTIGWGILLGLLPLVRTMTIAFVPAQLVLAVWLIWVRPGARRPRLINGVLGVLVAAIVASTWFVKSWRTQLHYLTNFGYGSESSHFSTSGSKLSVSYWTRELVATVRQDLYLPLAVIIVIALALALVALALRLRAPGAQRWAAVGGWARSWLAGDAAVVAAVVLEGYLAVTSSRNEGVGFRVPLLPGLLVLAVWALWRLPWSRIRTVLVVALVAVSLLNVVMKTNRSRVFSGMVSAQIPGFGSVPVIDGVGYIQGSVIGSGEAEYGSATHPLPSAQRRWMPAYAAIVNTIVGHEYPGAARPEVDLTTDEPLLNAYDLQFAAQLHHDDALVANVLPAPKAGTLSAYRATLVQARRLGINTLVTVDRPAVSYLGEEIPDAQSLFQQAAATLGYVCSATQLLPDGRTAFTEWVPRAGGASMPAPGCAPRVTSASPAGGAVGVPRTTAPSVALSAPIDARSIAGAIRVTDASGRAIAGVTLAFGDEDLVFLPLRRLPADAQLRAVLSDGLAGATGARLHAPYRWAFATGP